MSEMDNSGCELEKFEEVIGVVFIANDDAAEVVEPCEETFDLPAFAIAPKAATIIEGRSDPTAAVGSQKDDVLISQTLPQGSRVLGAVGDEVERVMNFLVNRAVQCHDIRALRLGWKQRSSSKAVVGSVIPAMSLMKSGHSVRRI